MTGTDHGVHLTEEPARALVWQEIAAYSLDWLQRQGF